MQRINLPLNIIFSLLILVVLARIVADVASYKLGKLGTGSGNSAPVSASRQQQTISDIKAAGVILDKGLFGPATRGVLQPIAVPAARTGAPAVVQTDLLLLGTAAGSLRESFILVRRLSTGEERVFRIGERVFDLGLLHAVRKETADIKNGSQLITLRTPLAPTEADKPATSAAQPVQQGVIMASSGGSGIIDQRALNAALDNIGQAMTDARLLPSVKDGKVEGFRVSEVKPQGVFAAVGLKNGDVLLKINEFPIDSPEKAIQSFMTLQGQNRIKLDLLRDGAPTSLTYDIR
jgi:general secretion pathway protein C